MLNWMIIESQMTCWFEHYLLNVTSQWTYVCHLTCSQCKLFFERKNYNHIFPFLDVMNEFVEDKPIGESIYDQKPPNPKKLIQKVFWRILVEFVMLNNILKCYPNLTSGKGSFPRWRPRWVSRSYNSHISITIQYRKVVFSDLVLNKAMISQNISTANYYWQIQDGAI